MGSGDVADTTTAEGRRAQRAAILDDCLAQARELAARRGRSMKCGADLGLYEGWKHAGEPDGCQNDGSSCICECHDPAPNTDVTGGTCG